MAADVGSITFDNLMVTDAGSIVFDNLLIGSGLRFADPKRTRRRRTYKAMYMYGYPVWWRESKFLMGLRIQPALSLAWRTNDSGGASEAP